MPRIVAIVCVGAAAASALMSAASPSAVCTTCLEFTVLRPIYMDGPASTRIDNPFLLTRIANQFVGYTANAFTYRLVGTTPDSLVLNPAAVLAPSSGISNPADPTFDGCGRWFQAIDASTSPLRGWYHAESGCYYPATRTSIAYTESNDGIAWTFPTNGQSNNQVVTYNPDPVPYASDVHGHGDPTVVRWRPPGAGEDYYYMYFMNATHTPEDDPNGPIQWMVSVARATVASGGVPGTWTKYFNGSWTSPGLAGRASKLTDMFSPGGFSVDGAQGTIVSATDDVWQKGIFAAVSDDGIQFTRVTEPLVPSESDWNRPSPWELLGYSSINAMSGGKSWSDRFHLYDMYIVPGADYFSRYQIRRTVLVREASQAVSPQVKLALARYSSATNHDSWTTTAYPAGDYVFQGYLGFIFTKAMPGRVPIADCVITGGGIDHIVPGTGTQGCPAGQMYLRTLGWVYDPAQAQPAGTAPIFRCLEAAPPSTHFVSRDANCSDLPGSAMELKLGYVLTQWTDEPLSPGAATIRAAHIVELRQHVDAIRGAKGLAPFAYTDATLSPTTTVVRAAHIGDLRAALADAYVAAGQTPPAYTDPDLTGATVKAVHIVELRQAAGAIE